MMRLWNLINGFEIKKDLKNSLYIFILIFFCLVAGALVWLIIGHFFLASISALWCFMGYPAVFIGLFGGVLFLYNHEFI